MKYLLKTLVALAMAVFALPWPATVLLRGFAMSIDYSMTWLVAKAKASPDSGVKAASLAASALLVLTGIWPVALLLSFITIWHERFIIWLFVRGLNIEETRRPETPEDEEPPPRYGTQREAKVHRLPTAEADRQQVLSAPQARAACEKHFDWDPHEHGLTWDFGRQLWRDKDGFFTDMNGDPVKVKAVS